MKVGNLLDLMNDSADLLDMFDGVETKDQLVSRLEVLKRRDADDLMACVDGLRHSVLTMREDVLEIGTALDSPEDDGEDTDLDALLKSVGEDVPGERENPPGENPAPNEKTPVQSSS